MTSFVNKDVLQLPVPLFRPFHTNAIFSIVFVLLRLKCYSTINWESSPIVFIFVTDYHLQSSRSHSGGSSSSGGGAQPPTYTKKPKGRKTNIKVTSSRGSSRTSSGSYHSGLSSPTHYQSCGNLVSKINKISFSSTSLISFTSRMEPPKLNVPAEVCFLMQSGVARDNVSIDSCELNLKSLKDLACNFVDRKFPEHGLNRLPERLMLFKHDYNQDSILTPINRWVSFF